VLDDVGDQHDVELAEPPVDPLGLAEVDLVIDVIVDRVVVALERLDPLQVELPLGGVEPLLLDVEVFAQEDAILPEPAPDVQNPLRLQAAHHGQDRADVVGGRSSA